MTAIVLSLNFRANRCAKTFVMPKRQTLIQFPSLQLLWQFAQRIQAVNIEIHTEAMTLLCDCSEGELSLLSDYQGKVIEPNGLLLVMAAPVYNVENDSSDGERHTG